MCIRDRCGTKLDCGGVSVESEWAEEKRASKIVQHQIPQHLLYLLDWYHQNRVGRAVTAELCRYQKEKGAGMLSILVLIKAPSSGLLSKRAVMRATV